MRIRLCLAIMLIAATTLMLAAEVESVALATLGDAGLLADFQLQSIAEEDFQEPLAGAETGEGSTVKVRIGFGD